MSNCANWRPVSTPSPAVLTGTTRIGSPRSGSLKLSMLSAPDIDTATRGPSAVACSTVTAAALSGRRASLRSAITQAPGSRTGCGLRAPPTVKRRPEPPETLRTSGVGRRSTPFLIGALNDPRSNLAGLSNST